MTDPRLLSDEEIDMERVRLHEMYGDGSEAVRIFGRVTVDRKTRIEGYRKLKAENDRLHTAIASMTGNA